MPKFLSYQHVLFYRDKMSKQFSFLDVGVIHEKGKFTITMYRKTTFSGLYSNFECFLPSVY